MQQIVQDISNNTYKSIYLLYGDEAYLRVQYKNKLKSAIIPEDDSMNYNYYEGKGINIGEVIDLSETLPFFADRRLIVMENTGLIKGGGEQLAEYVESIPETTVIVMAETEVDKRSKLYKAIQKYGRAVEFQTQSEETLKKWIVSRIRKEQKQITGNTLTLFLETVGSDMSNIVTELEKLFAYTLERDAITDGDIRAVCTVQLSNRVFDMISFISMRKQKEALKIYHEILELKESPFGIMALISKQFNNMLKIKELTDQGLNDKRIADKIGLSPYIIGKLRPQAKNFSHEEMITVLKNCVNVDHEVKKGNIDSELGVEMLIIEACSSLMLSD